MTRYSGLHRATFDFLAGLAANNDRAWFAVHRTEYETHWLHAGLDLIEALAPLCAEMTPRLLAVPKLNASLRRIHRDTRFSKDKTPYQPRMHLILSTGEPFNKVPGMHLVLSPEGLGFGAGHYGLETQALHDLRQRVCDADERGALLEAITAAERVGSRLDPPDLARVPKGYDAAPAWEALLRRKSMIVRAPSPQPAPDWLFTSEAPKGLARITRAHLPLLSWLRAPS